MKFLRSVLMLIVFALATGNVVAGTADYPADTSAIARSASVAVLDRMLEAAQPDIAGSAVGLFGNGLKLHAQFSRQELAALAAASRAAERRKTKQTIWKVVKIAIPIVCGLAWLITYLVKSSKGNAAGVPSTPTGTLSSWPVWTLAIFPPLAMMTSIFALFGVIAFFALGYLDVSNLRNAGYDPAPIKGMAWFPPVYLYKRSKLMGQGQAPLITHLVLLGLWVFSILLVIIALAVAG